MIGKHLRIKILAIAIALAVLAFPINTAEASRGVPIIFDTNIKPEIVIVPAPTPAPVVKAPKPQKRSNKIVSKPSKKAQTTYNPCSCVSYARFVTGINVGSIGVAKNHPVNSKTPVVGSILITYESRSGHASVVQSFDDKFVYVNEANYSRCKVTYNRAIPLDSKLIKGYYHE